jgi:hypothetical protein
MKRVILLVTLLLGLSTGWQLSTQAEGMNCKVECSTCASVCEKTLRYCSTSAGKHVESGHIDALKDCISTCKQSADFMARSSSLNRQACSLCEQACNKCAESCATFKDDKTMQACAEECKKCAKTCHEMAS